MLPVKPMPVLDGSSVCKVAILTHTPVEGLGIKARKATY